MKTPDNNVQGEEYCGVLIDEKSTLPGANTPDTEWEKEFDEIYGDYLSGYFCCDGRECGCNGTNVKTEIFLYIQNLLTARDTYWKERVRKEVEKKQKQVSGEKRLNAGLPNTQVFLDGYNHALNDIITLIERI